MNITAQKFPAGRSKPMPEFSVTVKTCLGDLLVREVANSANLIVHVVTTLADQFVGNINETWRGSGVKGRHFCIVTSDGLRHPIPFGGLVDAAKGLAKKAQEVAS
jgi:hypothetical protein